MDYLALLKHSLYIDGDYENEYLEFLIEASRETIMSALDQEVEPVNNKFKHAVILLAGHYYENRTETSETNIINIPFGVGSLINQLRGEFSNEDI